MWYPNAARFDKAKPINSRKFATVLMMLSPEVSRNSSSLLPHQTALIRSAISAEPAAHSSGPAMAVIVQTALSAMSTPATDGHLGLATADRPGPDLLAFSFP